MNTGIIIFVHDNPNIRINVLRKGVFKVRLRFRAHLSFYASFVLTEQIFDDTKFERSLYYIHFKCKDDIYNLEIYI